VIIKTETKNRTNLDNSPQNSENAVLRQDSASWDFPNNYIISTNYAAAQWLYPLFKVNLSFSHQKYDML